MKSRLAKLAFALIWLALFFELVFDSSVRQAMLSYCVEHPTLAPLALILTQLLLASFALPCSPLTVLAGVLWGFEIGILYATSATILSSLWTFFLGRYAFRNRFKEKMRLSWWPKIFGLVSRYKWKASMIAHANPVFPGSSLGYVFGMSDISALSFFFGAFMGTLPLQLIMVGLGFFTGQTIERHDSGPILIIAGLIAALIAYKILAPRIFKNVE